MIKTILGMFKRKYKKHKKWFIVLLALDILSIPVAAQMVDHVSFSAPQKVASVKLDTDKAGLQRFVVASYGPFVVISEKAIGQFQVNLRTKATINGKEIGMNAQLPGSGQACSVATSLTPQKIYEAVRKTAAKPGEVLSQAVIVDIKYDPALSPEFKIMTQTNALKFQAPASCETV